jgi:DNA repair exonuclease SbcCD ATPase subunit
MKITKLKIRNYRGIEALDIEAADINLFVGKNFQGKTGVLDAIVAGMRGKVPPEAIHHDAEKSEILIDLDDGMSIHRRIPAKGKQTVTVKKERAKLQSPQAVLDSLFAEEGFDPIQFIKAKDRQKRLLEALPVTTTPKEILAYLEGVGLSKADVKGLRTDSAHAFEVFGAVAKMLADERKGVNREVKQLAGWIKQEKESLGDAVDPAEEIDALSETQKQIAGELANARGLAKQVSAAESAVDEAERDLSQRLEASKAAEREVRAAKQQLQNAEARLEDAQTAHGDQQERLDNAQTTVVTLKENYPEFEDAISNLTERAEQTESQLSALKEKRGAYQEALRQQGAVEAKEAELAEKKDRAKALDAGVKLFAKQAPAEALAKTPMPVEGLEYRDGKFFVNGTHIDQLSGAETIQVACQFTLEKVRQKGLHVLCVDGLELLDDDQRAQFFSTMTEAGVQLWATEVNHGQAEPDGDGVLYVVMSGGAPANVKATPAVEPEPEEQTGISF